MNRKKKPKSKRLTAVELLKKGVPAVLIPGIILAGALGWKGEELKKALNYHQIKTIFPDQGVVSTVEDGDTFMLRNDVRIRMLGIDAPGRGEKGFEEGKLGLSGLLGNKKVYLEYDRYQDDKYGRVLAWVWIDCERKPTFLPADYMHLTYNTSRSGLVDNPVGCKKGKLVNEEMVRSGFTSYEKYKDRGELKYEGRIISIIQ
ncbi:hypothetical protein A2154_02195 [Candidatus Gottesmanbacteria bacterium RBG_16_43_7]|uniref:TNase-like domain-containing protein n=1 Tax=Candidatus Gottesmanbacteria bacterium RBG_16_43_7 TaxID=1798373 RepID=A0A1F5Z8U2_9BACT|nr:MAG: hypothetical protein A2154_02195 [Candidatus Gottesmanbacteria bacterium RBG_16_43_7]